MADNIGVNISGHDTFAFRGDRADIWHRKGNQHQPGWSVDDWAARSGLDFHAHKVPAYADISAVPALASLGRLNMLRAPNQHLLVRGDTGHVLSKRTVTDQYKPVQPREVLDWFQQYVAVDPRFQLDTAGALFDGETIFATAVFNGDNQVAGERHRMRLLMTTTFDASGSTINRGTTTRVVCNNTLDAALLEKEGGIVRTRHTTQFDAKAVGAELAKVAQSFEQFKAMGEAMAGNRHSPDDVAAFFKIMVDVPHDAKKADISKRTWGKLEKMHDAYFVGVRQEGLEARTQWAMLQGVTRFADHDRPVRGSEPGDTRFATSVVDSSGGGAQMKQKAVMLLNDMSNGDLLKAVMAKTEAARSQDDFAKMLAKPFRPTVEQ